MNVENLALYLMEVIAIAIVAIHAVPVEMRAIFSVGLILTMVFRLVGVWQIPMIISIAAGVLSGNPLVLAAITVLTYQITALTHSNAKIVGSKWAIAAVAIELLIITLASAELAKTAWHYLAPVSGWLGSIIMLKASEKVAYAAIVALLIIVALIGMDVVVFPLMDVIRGHDEAKAYILRYTPKNMSIWRTIGKILINLAPILLFVVLTWLLGG